jgi:hypothetical protein
MPFLVETTNRVVEEPRAHARARGSAENGLVRLRRRCFRLDHVCVLEKARTRICPVTKPHPSSRSGRMRKAPRASAPVAAFFWPEERLLMSADNVMPGAPGENQQSHALSGTSPFSDRFPASVGTERHTDGQHEIRGIAMVTTCGGADDLNPEQIMTHKTVLRDWEFARAWLQRESTGRAGRGATAPARDRTAVS